MKTNLLLSLLCFSLFASPLFADLSNCHPTQLWEENASGARTNYSLCVFEIFRLEGKRRRFSSRLHDFTNAFQDAVRLQKEYDSLYASAGFDPPDFKTGKIPAVISDAARGHFVMGTTLFKDVHTKDDYIRTEREFAKAVELAPGWPDAHYNLALVLEAEASSGIDTEDNYMEAIVHFKFYLDLPTIFADNLKAKHLPHAEWEKVRDKIYEIKAKAQKAEDYIPPRVEAVPAP